MSNAMQDAGANPNASDGFLWYMPPLFPLTLCQKHLSHAIWLVASFQNPRHLRPPSLGMNILFVFLQLLFGCLTLGLHGFGVVCDIVGELCTISWVFRCVKRCALTRSTATLLHILQGFFYRKKLISFARFSSEIARSGL